jgi:hypothetical protein
MGDKYLEYASALRIVNEVRKSMEMILPPDEAGGKAINSITLEDTVSFLRVWMLVLTIKRNLRLLNSFIFKSRANVPSTI